MNVKTKRKLEVIVDGMLNQYGDGAMDKSKQLQEITKAVGIVRDIEDGNVENRIKRKRIRLDEAKLSLEQEKIELDAKKLEIEEEKIQVTKHYENRKLELEQEKLSFEREKFLNEERRQKADKIFMTVVRGLEMGIPLIVYSWLSISSLKASYADDVRVPSETWTFIKNLSRVKN